MRFNKLFNGVPLGQETLGPQEIPKNSISLGAVAAISAGSALLSSVGNWLSQRSANAANASMDKATREWQSMENLTAYEREKKFWNMQNEYNTPSAQRQRLQEAGYNPWISGSGGMSNVSQGAPSMSMQGAPNRTPQQPVNFSSIAQGGQSIVQAMLNSENVNANVANQNADTAIKIARACSEMLKSGMNKESVYNWASGQMKTLGFSSDSIGNIRQLINQDFLSSQIKNDRDALEYFLRNKYGSQEAQKNLDLLDKQMLKLDEDINYLKSNEKVNDAKIDQLAAQAARDIQAKITDEETRAFVKRKLEAEAKILEADPMSSEWFASFSKSSPVIANIIKFFGLLMKKF